LASQHDRIVSRSDRRQLKCTVTALSKVRTSMNRRLRGIPDAGYPQKLSEDNPVSCDSEIARRPTATK
jgi:hypothetical protein